MRVQMLSRTPPIVCIYSAVNSQSGHRDGRHQQHIRQIEDHAGAEAHGRVPFPD